MLSFLYSPILTSIHDYWKNWTIAGILPRAHLKLPMIVKHKELIIGTRLCTFVRGGYAVYVIQLFLRLYQPCRRRIVVVVQLLSRVQPFATPWTLAWLASLSFTISQSLFKLMSIVSMMPSNHLILYYPLIFLPSIFPRIRAFYNKSALCIRWLKYRSFSFRINPSNEYSVLISFRMSWFDLPLVQETLKSLF